MQRYALLISHTAKALDRILYNLKFWKEEKLKWENLEELGIDSIIFKELEDIKTNPVMFFCHPTVLDRNPELVAYYKSVAGISQKKLVELYGSSKIISMEQGLKPRDIPLIDVCKTLNNAVCEILPYPVDIGIAEAVIAIAFHNLVNGPIGTWKRYHNKKVLELMEEVSNIIGREDMYRNLEYTLASKIPHLKGLETGINTKLLDSDSLKLIIDDLESLLLKLKTLEYLKHKAQLKLRNPRELIENLMIEELENAKVLKRDESSIYLDVDLYDLQIKILKNLT
jgi:hypothetical protein